MVMEEGNVMVMAISDLLRESRREAFIILIKFKFKEYVSRVLEGGISSADSLPFTYLHFCLCDNRSSTQSVLVTNPYFLINLLINIRNVPALSVISGVNAGTFLIATDCVDVAKTEVQVCKWQTVCRWLHAVSA